MWEPTALKLRYAHDELSHPTSLATIIEVSRTLVVPRKQSFHRPMYLKGATSTLATPVGRYISSHLSCNQIEKLTGCAVAGDAVVGGSGSTAEGLSGAVGGKSRLVGAPGSSGVPAGAVGDTGVAASVDVTGGTSSALVGAPTAGCSTGCCSATGTGASGAGGTGTVTPESVRTRKGRRQMQHIKRMSETARYLEQHALAKRKTEKHGRKRHTI